MRKFLQRILGLGLLGLMLASPVVLASPQRQGKKGGPAGKRGGKRGGNRGGNRAPTRKGGGGR
jgi:hypothetical protein